MKPFQSPLLASAAFFVAAAAAQAVDLPVRKAADISLFGNVPIAYAQLAPSGGTSGGNLRERVDAIPGVAIGDPGAALDAGQLVVAPAQTTRAWASGFGYTSRVGADINGPGFKSSGGGATVGIDRFLHPTFLAGVALSYSRGETSALGANSDTDTISGAVYGAWLPYAGWEIEGLLGIDGTEIDTRRTLTFGTTSVVTRGNTESLGFNAVGNVGYRFRFAAPMGQAFLKPFAGVSYASQDRDAYTEFGAFGPGLVFPSKTFERSTFNLGAAVGIDIAAGNGWTIRPELRVAWSHYLNDPNPPVLAFLAGTPVVLRDPDPGRDGAVVGLELTAMTSNFQLFAGYAGEFRDNSEAHQGRLGLRVSW